MTNRASGTRSELKCLQFGTASWLVACGDGIDHDHVLDIQERIEAGQAELRNVGDLYPFELWRLRSQRSADSKSYAIVVAELVAHANDAL